MRFESAWPPSAYGALQNLEADNSSQYRQRGSADCLVARGIVGN
jgi:hypothetical protein